MTEIVKITRIDLEATFVNLKVGNIITLTPGDGVTEGNVRAKASRFSKKNNIGLRVTTSATAGKITVTRYA